MGRKIRFTQKQMDYINEMTLDGDAALSIHNGDAKAAAQDVIDDAQKNGVNVSNGVDVTFSSDSLRKNCGISESVISGKQLREMRLKYLRKNSTPKTKKDLFK